MMIKYIKGDATNPKTNNKVMIVHICNNVNKWGKGFVLALSNKWTNLRSEYLKMNKNMGNIDIVQVEKNIFVCNMIAQNGINSRYIKFDRRVDYDSLRECLNKVYKYAADNGMEIHMPKIGTGLAGGEWKIIENIIRDTLKNLEVVVYEFEQMMVCDDF